MTTNNNSPELVPAADDWFDQWLDHGTVAQISVPIYGRPDLFARYQDLERKMQVADQLESAGEKPLGYAGADTLHEQMRALYDEWQASKTVWFMRGLADVEIDDIRERLGVPEEPGDDATDEQKKAYADKVEKLGRRMNHEYVAASLVRVENANGYTVKTSITPAEVEALHKRLGTQQVTKLIQAAMGASMQDVEIPVPFSPTSSKKDQSS